MLLALVGLWRDRMRLRATLALLIGLYSIYDTISGHFQNRENIRQALAACRQAYLEQEGPNRRSYQFGWYMRTVSLCGESLTEQELLEVAGQPDFLDEAEGGRQWGYVYNQQGGLVHWIRILVKDGKTVLIEQRQDHMNHFSHLTPCKKEQTEQE